MRAARGPMPASSSPAVPRSSSPQRFAAMGEVDLVLGNREKLEAESFAASSGIRVSDIMGLRETAAHMIAGFTERARAYRRDAKRLRSSLHLLHYSIRARALAQRPCGRCGGAGADARRKRLCRNRAHGCGPHRLWRRSSARAETRPTRARRARASAGTQAPPPIFDRTRRKWIPCSSSSWRARSDSCRISIFPSNPATT